MTAYGLAVEHTLGDQVVWKGDGGRTYFYQSELPYDVTCDELRARAVDAFALLALLLLFQERRGSGGRREGRGALGAGIAWLTLWFRNDPTCASVCVCVCVCVFANIYTHRHT